MGVAIKTSAGAVLWGWNRKLPGSQSEHLNNRAQGVPWSRERLARGPGPPLPCDLAHQPSPADRAPECAVHVGRMSWFGECEPHNSPGLPTPGCYSLNNLLKAWMVPQVKMGFDSSHIMRGKNLGASQHPIYLWIWIIKDKWYGGSSMSIEWIIYTFN